MTVKEFYEWCVERGIEDFIITLPGVFSETADIDINPDFITILETFKKIELG